MQAAASPLTLQPLHAPVAISSRCLAKIASSRIRHIRRHGVLPHFVDRGALHFRYKAFDYGNRFRSRDSRGCSLDGSRGEHRPVCQFFLANRS